MVSTESPAAKSNPRRELVEREIMEQATRLFAEKGFASTTLQDIADATGLTRPALYHYVANKDELFSKLVAEIASSPAELLHGINERADLDAVGKLREMAMAIALHQAREPERFRLLIRSEAELPAAVEDVYRQSRRRVLNEFMAVIDDGIDRGQFRPTDPRTAALGIIGMLNWIAWWHRPGDDTHDQQISRQLADMAVRSVIDLDPESGRPTPDRLLGEIRHRLDELEKFTEAARKPNGS